MYHFSILIEDSIVEELDKKIAISSRFGIGNLELPDRVDGTDIADISGEQADRIRNLLITNLKRLVLVHCSRPIADLDYYKRLFQKASLLGVEAVKVPVEDILEEAAADQFKELCRIGRAYDIGVLIENCCNTPFSKDKEITRFYKSVKNEVTGLIFNPLEYVREKSHPFFHEFYSSKLKGEIRFLRVNDGLFADGSPALPGQGNAEIKELASILLARSFKGYFSFTPYLGNGGEEEFEHIIHHFKKLLVQM